MDDASHPIALPDATGVSLWQIALTFLCIGSVSFSLAALEETRTWMTQKRAWFTDDEYMQGLGLAQILPGAPTINLSAYLGFRLRGLAGAAVATTTFLIPSFLLILLLSHLYFVYGRMPVVSGLFHGLGALVTGLVLNTVLNLWKKGVVSAFNWLMALAGFGMVFFFKVGIFSILLVTGAASVVMVLASRLFPGCSWWMETNADFGKRITRPKANLAVSISVNGNPIDIPGDMSVCSRMSLLPGWRKTMRLVCWLVIILGGDWALIQLQPKLAAMGCSFLRIGALVFGSGYAMLPFIQDIVIHRFGWLTSSEFAVGLALSLVTPGPVTIIGAFVGYKVWGVVGAVTGLFNMYFPAWAMTILAAAPYARAGRVEPVRRVISGVVAGFIGTLVVVLLRLAAGNLMDIPAIVMAAGAFIVQRYARVNTVWIVLGGAVISLVIFR